MTNEEIAHKLATATAGALVKNLTDRKEDLIGGLPVVARVGVRLAWDPLMHALPPGAEAALNAVLDEFGELSVHDLLGFLADRAAKAGRYDVVARMGYQVVHPMDTGGPSLLKL